MRYNSLALAVVSILALLSIILIILLEIAIRRHRNGEALAVSTSLYDDPPLASLFTFRYLPIMITVAYGLIWGWIDLQAKRAEPFMHLVNGEGSSAEESLLLSYFEDLAFVVPFKAFRRWYVQRHGLSGWPLTFPVIGSCSVAAWRAFFQSPSLPPWQALFSRSNLYRM